jgi:hypothetical protein
MKPALSSSRDFILNLISFGIEGFKDTAYIEISKGLHEGVSVELLSRFTFLLVILTILFISHILEQLADAKYKREKLTERVNEIIRRVEDTGEEKEKEQSPEDMKKSLLDLRQSMETSSLLRFKIASYSLILITVVIVSFAVVESIRTTYVNSAVTHFQQMYNIALPFMDDNKKVEILASFAQIKKRSDYVSIVDDLKTVAQSNGQTVPDFSAW